MSSPTTFSTQSPVTASPASSTQPSAAPAPQSPNLGAHTVTTVGASLLGEAIKIRSTLVDNRIHDDKPAYMRAKRTDVSVPLEDARSVVDNRIRDDKPAQPAPGALRKSPWTPVLFDISAIREPLEDARSVVDNRIPCPFGGVDNRILDDKPAQSAPGALRPSSWTPAQRESLRLARILNESRDLITDPAKLP